MLELKSVSGSFSSEKVHNRLVKISDGRVPLHFFNFSISDTPKPMALGFHFFYVASVAVGVGRFCCVYVASVAVGVGRFYVF